MAAPLLIPSPKQIQTLVQVSKPNDSGCSHARIALSRAFRGMISRSFRSCTSASARTETVDFRSLKGHHPCKRARPDWRSSFLCLPHSSDVWANPEFFLLDEFRRPRFVAGVLPDYFSAQDQLWGNPVYNWDALLSTGYRWCIDRMRAHLAHVDAIRLDHFREFVAAWHVPKGAATAQTGEWVPGPGAAFFRAIQKELGCLPFIAEDLGIITSEVRALRDELAVPGTRVLQFAFDGHSDN